MRPADDLFYIIVPLSHTVKANSRPFVPIRHVSNANNNIIVDLEGLSMATFTERLKQLEHGMVLRRKI